MDTSTREIPRNEWVAFLDSFSRQHEGWLITIEVLGRDIGAQIERREQPLTGITADLTDGGRDTITILGGGKSVGHLAHIIRAPLHVWLKETEEGAHEALQIESKDRTTTLVRFHSAVLPETVDGVLNF